MPNAEVEVLYEIAATLKNMPDCLLDWSEGRAILEKDPDNRVPSTTDAVIRLERTVARGVLALERIAVALESPRR